MQTRRGGTGEPARAGWPACDYRTGDLSAFVILLALYRRLRTDIHESQHLQASLSGTGTYLQIPFMSTPPGGAGTNRSGSLPPMGAALSPLQG
jgi:crotonobetainyl-CoA:carnitine CoA-transferase CaiB-like acyl-CoA transferase